MSTPAHRAQAHPGPLVQGKFDETLYPETGQSKSQNKKKNQKLVYKIGILIIHCLYSRIFS